MTKRLAITQAEARAYFDYDPETGLLFARQDRPTKLKLDGTPRKARHVTNANTPRSADGYVMVGLLRHSYLAHRFIWLWMTGSWPEFEIDHVNRIRHDNRWANLRDVPHVKNIHNSTRALSPEVINLTRYHLQQGMRYGAAAKLTGISVTQAYNLKMGHSYKTVPYTPPPITSTSA